MTNLAKTYDPQNLEDRLYQRWKDLDLFSSQPDSTKQPYTIVMPPPNVTGMLHMGHVLVSSLQDSYIRWHKLRGFEACWIPGTDHASIATEAKVVKKLAEQGISKEDIGREEFLKKAWEWKEKYGGIIYKQLEKLGCSADWHRQRFTMDDDFYDLVVDTFVDLYNKGYIYRGYRLVNWCPVSQSVISDEEVLFEEQNGKLWYFRYPVKDSEDYVVIATTRPETMFGDTAVAVHPDNNKLNKYIGQKLILPIANREIPIIADFHADPQKGSGAVKITPAHDPNDYLVGKRHNLEFISIMNTDATLNDKVPEDFRGLDRYIAREKVIVTMQGLGLVDKIEDHTHQISISERGKVPIEYLMSNQWYIAMEELVKPAIKVVEEGKIRMHPKHWEKTYFNWLYNIQDWCVSRQLWWGHRIPAFYCSNKGCEDVVMVTKNQPKKCPKCGKGNAIFQEEDVLDTWASSWLWPFGVHRDQKDEDYYYPTDLLITGPDIIFFWVARMIIASMHYKGKIPFKDVYFNGIVRDEKGRKMSKSLGNSEDPLDVIRDYGADALRFAMIRLTPTGNDVLFSRDKCELGRNFANKIWNAARFLEMHRQGFQSFTIQRHLNSLEDRWVNSCFERTLMDVWEKMAQFKPNEALKAVYEFIWNEFCDWYIEFAKSRLNSDNLKAKQEVLENAYFLFERSLKILHPFMPFVTEEIWLNLEERKKDASIMQENIVIGDDRVIDLNTENAINNLKEIVGRIRNIRGEYNIPPNKELSLLICSKEFLPEESLALLKFMAKIGSIQYCLPQEFPKLCATFIVKGNELAVPLSDFIDTDKEKIKIEQEIIRLTNINKSIDKKLSNQKFIQNAPEAVVQKEKMKYKNNVESLKILNESLQKYN